MNISFMNQLRLIAEKFPLADIHTILDAIGSDTRIGKKFLRAGLSYGGPFFPRDNRLLAYTARRTGGEAPLAEASDKVNELTKSNLLQKVIELAPAGATVLVLGVSYKPDTYITEESAGLHLAQNLKQQGRRVIVHDFAATAANNPALKELELLNDLNNLNGRNDINVAVVCCPWPQYRDLKFSPAT